MAWTRSTMGRKERRWRRRVGRKKPPRNSRITHQWHVRHIVNNHTLVLRRVLRYSSQVRFDDVVAVQERQLSGLLDPHLQVSPAPLGPARPSAHRREPSSALSAALLPAGTKSEALSAARMIELDHQLTLYLAYCAIQSRHVTPNLNLPDLENLPKHVPMETRFGRAIDVAR